jgi:hypothetical protein
MYCRTIYVYILHNQTIAVQYKLQNANNRSVSRTVKWLRRLVVGFSPRRPGFATRSAHVGFVMKKVALGRGFLRVLQVFPDNIIPPEFYTRISSGDE